MPRHEFTCSAGHTTTRVYRIKDEVPASIRCPDFLHPDGEHANHRRCRRKAVRHQVYRVGVQGSLPTRGAF